VVSYTAPSSVSAGLEISAPGDRDPELHAGRVGVALELGHSAEQPEVDARDRDAVADRHHRVTELVQQDREEEQKRADRG
jgi:hypothetical protein